MCFTEQSEGIFQYVWILGLRVALGFCKCEKLPIFSNCYSTQGNHTESCHCKKFDCNNEVFWVDGRRLIIHFSGRNENYQFRERFRYMAQYFWKRVQYCGWETSRILLQELAHPSKWVDKLKVKVVQFLWYYDDVCLAGLWFRTLRLHNKHELINPYQLLANEDGDKGNCCWPRILCIGGEASDISFLGQTVGNIDVAGGGNVFEQIDNVEFRKKVILAWQAVYPPNAPYEYVKLDETLG